MSPKASLADLAEAHQIEPDYVDIWGRQHSISDETKRALLTAMGVPSSSDAEIEASFEAIRHQAFQRLTPPVLIAGEQDPIDLPIATKVDLTGSITWRFQAETGEISEGEASLQDLAITRMESGRAKRSLPLPLRPEPGYHRLTISLDGKEQAETEIIVTPMRAFWPEGLDRRGGLRGLTAPLYGLRSSRNAGIGDFFDLAELASITAPLGADFIGINPVHALFPNEPQRISPYSPSSRLFLNGLHIAIDHANDLLRSSSALATTERLRAGDLVDYPAVAAFKRPVFEALFSRFSTLPASSAERAAFDTFLRSGGEALERHICFEALAETLSTSKTGTTDWRDWPAPYQSPTSPEVQAFAKEHAERVTFYGYLQWLAAEQLADAKQRASDAGMALGLYLDLAVGTAPDGAEAWAHQDVLVNGVRIGAPPDDFNPDGQNWGLLPFSPTALKAKGYRPFIDLLRRNMRYAGALRIDHILGLARSFWQPADGSAPGAYIRYPMQDLLGLVALESVRNQCLVIGEDLGTVPPALRKALDEQGLLGCRLLYFERDDNGASRPASAYPKTCIASIGTHDLPTLKGFWEGRDITVRAELQDTVDDAKERAEHTEREQVKVDLLSLLEAEDLLPDGIDPTSPPAVLLDDLTLAFHRFLGKTPSFLKAVQLEDVTGAREQANLPGTIDEHPNWRRKISMPLEGLLADERLSLLLQAISKAD